MSVKIRMSRRGAKKKPFYRIVVIDSRDARDARPVEEIGYYNPLSENKELKVDEEKLQDWLSKGAKLSATLETLLKKKKTLQKENETPSPAASSQEPAAGQE